MLPGTSQSSCRGFVAILLASIVAVACSGSTSTRRVENVGLPKPREASGAAIHHVFVINLENQGFEQTFGPGSGARYLSGALRAKGQLLENYFAIGHASLPNYIAQISGQAPAFATQHDCTMYSDFHETGLGKLGQAIGDGCIYPSDVKTIADQLDAAHFTWRAYYEDMEESPTEPRTCRHRPVGTRDDRIPKGGRDLYTTRTNPFVYFHSIIDGSECKRRVVPLSFLNSDLAELRTSPNLAYITPNLCHNGHNRTCGAGVVGGLTGIDVWLEQWVPKILDSAAFRAGGLLAVVFDEAEFDATACCGETAGPNARLPGIYGPGGGRVAALLIGNRIAPGSTNLHPYNHYSLLCSVENLFHLPHLGMAAAPGLPCFGRDVFSEPSGGP